MTSAMGTPFGPLGRRRLDHLDPFRLAWSSLDPLGPYWTLKRVDPIGPF